MEIRVIDRRNKEKFFVDDEYLNGYAKYLGTTTSMVYFVLCRHADKHQECFPSTETIGDKIGVKRHTVMRSINTLCTWNIISKGFQERISAGKWGNNTYTLLDKSVWINKPCSTHATPTPCSTHAPNRVALDARTVLHPCDTKEPHTEGTTSKEPHTESFNAFWEEYPNKKNKKNTLKTWNKIKPDKTTFEKIMYALEQQKKTKQWKENNGQFIPHPTTWLNGERWNDLVNSTTKLTSKYAIYDNH